MTPSTRRFLVIIHCGSTPLFLQKKKSPQDAMPTIIIDISIIYHLIYKMNTEYAKSMSIWTRNTSLKKWHVPLTDLIILIIIISETINVRRGLWQVVQNHLLKPHWKQTLAKSMIKLNSKISTISEKNYT